MKKILAWLVGITSIGKKVNGFLDGKKQALASLATALAATATIIAKASEQGTAYLMGVASTPEFIAASGGWIAFFNALKGEKLRAEIAGVAQSQDIQAQTAEAKK